MSHAKYLLAAGVAVALAGCASIEVNPALEQARTNVSAAAANPDVVARAPVELRAAQHALDHATALWRKGESRPEVNHLAYLAQTRALTAIDLARSRRAADELARAQAEAEGARLAIRTREAQVARAQANAQARAAEDARQQAEAANRQAAMATQQAEAESARAAQAQAEAAEAKQRLALMQTRIIEIEGKHTERGILVTLGDVLFEFDKAELVPAAQPRLDKLADFLKQFPERKLLIEGYTDSIGTDRYNKDLSQRRADAVRAALVRRGIDPGRMVVEGYGESYPVATNNSESGRQMNRRVEVVVSDEAGTLKPRA